VPPLIREIPGCDDQCGVDGFVLEGAEAVVVALTAVRVVSVFEPFEESGGELVQAVPIGAGRAARVAG
jgi:hypothetical protein